MAFRSQTQRTVIKATEGNPFLGTEGDQRVQTVPTRMEVRELLGLGFWVQGFRIFPWLAANSFLKNGLRLSPSTYQLIKNSVDLPMVVKPIHGVLSDAVYIRGGHRLPYIAIGAILQALCWYLMALLPESFLTISTFCILLLVSNFGASIAEAANDAIVAEIGKETKYLGRLQSFVSMCFSIGGILGNLLGGVALKKLPRQIISISFALILTFQFLITINVSEQSLSLPEKKIDLSTGATVVCRTRPRQQFIVSSEITDHSQGQSLKLGSTSRSSSIIRQLHEMWNVLQTPAILYSICWLAASCAIVPILTETMFFYHCEHLNLDESVVALSRVFGQVFVFAWSVAYNKWLNRISARRLLFAVQGTGALIMVSDIFFINGFYRDIGVSDSMYVIIFSAILRDLLHFKMLPFKVLMTQLCPTGCEGSVMALVASAAALSNIVSGYFGVALATLAGISRDDYSGLKYCILMQVICTLVPLYWSSWIFEDGRPEKKNE